MHDVWLIGDGLDIMAYLEDEIRSNEMTYSERSTINVRFHASEELPKVGEVREAQGLAHWKYRVLHIINVSRPDSARRVMVKMHVERWIVEAEAK